MPIFKKLSKLANNSVDTIMQDATTTNINQSDNQDILSKFANDKNRNIIVATRELKDMQDNNSYRRRILPHDTDKLKSNQEIAKSILSNRTDHLEICSTLADSNCVREATASNADRDAIIKNARMKNANNKLQDDKLANSKKKEEDIEDLTYGF